MRFHPDGVNKQTIDAIRTTGSVGSCGGIGKNERLDLMAGESVLLVDDTPLNLKLLVLLLTTKALVSR